jgi:hypothetical protein
MKATYEDIKTRVLRHGMLEAGLSKVSRSLGIGLRCVC